MALAVVPIYILICLIVGWFGRNKAAGFAGFFVLSLLLTPPIMILALIVAGSNIKS